MIPPRGEPVAVPEFEADVVERATRGLVRVPPTVSLPAAGQPAPPSRLPRLSLPRDVVASELLAPPVSLRSGRRV